MAHPIGIHKASHIGEYDSEFESESETSKTRKRANDELHVSSSKKNSSHIFQDHSKDSFFKEQRRVQRFHFRTLDAYSRHKEIINHYFLCYPGSTAKLTKCKNKYKTDRDVIKENHKFLWEDDEEANSWGKQLAKRYYEKLFKEYCLADLKHYKKNKIALRWRTEAEVIDGIGQFSCGNINCIVKDNLTSWEVNFAYVEHGEKKNALVKLRLCKPCSYKLNFHHSRKTATTGKSLVSDIDKIATELKGSNTSELEESRDRHSCDLSHHSTSSSYSTWEKTNSEDIHSNQCRADEFEQYLCEMLL